jgi:hypothetical protein
MTDMRNDPTLRLGARHRSPTDGWLGTRELPGYRAGNVIARLDDLPQVDPDHLYFDLLLLDAGGQLQGTHSGPCYALARQRSFDERSRFVRVVAELVRHAPGDAGGLSGMGQVLSFIRQSGVEIDRLVLAARLLDAVCSERAVIESLNHLLELSLGAEEASREMCGVVSKLACESGFASLDTPGAPAPDADFESGVSRINGAGLPAQVSYVVRTIGKARARRYLRELIDFALVPTPEMFGV